MEAHIDKESHKYSERIMIKYRFHYKINLLQTTSKVILMQKNTSIDQGKNFSIGKEDAVNHPSNSITIGGVT